MAKTRVFRCNSCGDKFRSTVFVQQYFGQVDENGNLLLNVGICPECYRLESSFRRLLETNLENVPDEEKSRVIDEMSEEGYEV